MTNRDISIDILRFIALSGIILIHIHPGNFFAQLRSFDVPLMVFLSGVSYYLSTYQQSNPIPYKKYCIKRFVRLILPVWFYLPIYFLLYTIIQNELPTGFQIVTYYTLATQWYVWIIRVFFIIALFAPFIAQLTTKLKNKSFYICLGSIFILFECITMYGNFTSFSSVTFLTNIPYLLIFAIGYKVSTLKNKQITIWGGVFLFIFISYAILFYNMNGNFILTGKYKYPPQLYYTSYAMSICLFLWAIKEKIAATLRHLPLQVTQLFCFIGSHSMWIYLWHIPIVESLEHSYSAPIRFITVYGGALCITYLQLFLIKKVCSLIQNEKMKKNIKTIFIG